MNYVACMLLSTHPDGSAPDQLQREIEAFLKDPKALKLPWYLVYCPIYLLTRCPMLA